MAKLCWKKASQDMSSIVWHTYISFGHTGILYSMTDILLGQIFDLGTECVYNLQVCHLCLSMYISCRTSKSTCYTAFSLMQDTHTGSDLR